jgi:hypothetical protein
MVTSHARKCDWHLTAWVDPFLVKADLRSLLQSLVNDVTFGS